MPWASGKATVTSANEPVPSVPHETTERKKASMSTQILTSDHVTYNINSSISILSKMLDDPAILQSVCKVADVITDCLGQGNTVAFCGNGGSAAQAQHFATELMGRFLKNRKPYKAICLNSDVAVMTAIANDYGYEQVFARQVEGLLYQWDCLVVLSTSGSSPNCLHALYEANGRNVATVAITGEAGPNNHCQQAARYPIAIPTVGSARIQEATLVIIHALCEIIERRLN